VSAAFSSRRRGGSDDYGRTKPRQRKRSVGESGESSENGETQQKACRKLVIWRNSLVAKISAAKLIFGEEESEKPIGKMKKKTSAILTWRKAGEKYQISSISGIA
jgi:hypothetical protein